MFTVIGNLYVAGFILDTVANTLNSQVLNVVHRKLSVDAVVIDFAHHPAEIIATLRDAARQSTHLKRSRLLYFQPHTFTYIIFLVNLLKL